jgi:hypothetical protein
MITRIIAAVIFILGPASAAMAGSTVMEIACGSTPKAPALAAIFVGLRRPFWLGLRVADSFGEHLAKIGLGLGGLPFSWLPLGHGQYVGMREAELNPSTQSYPSFRSLAPARTAFLASSLSRPQPLVSPDRFRWR